MVSGFPAFWCQCGFRFVGRGCEFHASCAHRALREQRARGVGQEVGLAVERAANELSRVRHRLTVQSETPGPDTARASFSGWCVWLVGGYCASGLVCVGGLLGGAACADVVVVHEFVVARAEQDEVVELRRATTLHRDDVVGFEFALGGAAGVLAVL